MPHKPDFNEVTLDPRLDPFRERVGLLTRAGEEAGQVYVRSEAIAWRESGHLWWTRWKKPVEVAHLFVYLIGEFNDAVLFQDELHDWVANWQADQFEWLGEMLEVRWLDESTSRRIRAEELGFDKAGNE